jgi:hypothetical protein
MEPEVRERFERLENLVGGLTEVVSGLVTVAAEQGRAMREGFEQLRLRQEKTDEQIKHTDGTLSVLIRMMDEWIRSNPRNGKGS